MRRSLTISNVGEPALTLETAKAYLRVLHSDDDEFLTRLIRMAFDHCEARTGRQFRGASAVLRMSAFPADGGQIVLPRPVVASVESVKYYDTTNTLRTLTGHQVQTDLVPAVIDPPVDDTEWPDTITRIDAVEIAYTCAGDYPERIEAAVLAWLDVFYNDLDPAKEDRLKRRIDNILGGMTLRDPRLYGVTT